MQIKLRSFDLNLETTYDLFSYKKIDQGTKLLIDNLVVKTGETCLDLGCGYGVVGIVMAKLNPTGQVYFVDRDLVATQYTKLNCGTNQVKNYQVLPSNGFEALGNIKFDLIAANLPTHIAKQSLIKIISDSKIYLTPAGKFYIVVTRKLVPFISKLLQPVFNQVKTVQQDNRYSVLLVTND